MEIKIGIGVVTYNRLEHLQRVLQSIRQFTPETHDLFVSDDGSTDGQTVPWLQRAQIEHVSEPNKGVVYSKNRVIKRFWNYDYIFIVEDDIEIMKSGWVSLHVEALERSNTHHLNFIPYTQEVVDPTKSSPPPITVLDKEPLPSSTIYACSRLCGIMMVLSKKVVETCGGLDFRFRGYGFGHGEYTERIHRAGLTRFRYPALKEAVDYMRLLPVNHVLTPEQVQEGIERNKRIAKLCHRDSSLWRPFDPANAGEYAQHVLRD